MIKGVRTGLFLAVVSAPQALLAQEIETFANPSSPTQQAPAAAAPIVPSIGLAQPGYQPGGYIAPSGPVGGYYGGNAGYGGAVGYGGLAGGAGYGGSAGGVLGGNGSTFGGGIPGVPQWTPYGAPPGQPVSAAVPGATFGLPNAALQNREQRTVFGPPATAQVDESPSTTPDKGSVGFGRGASGEGGAVTLDDISNPSSSFFSGSGSEGLNARHQVLVGAARSLGTKAGYASEAGRLNEALERYGAQLTQRYDFSRLQNGYVMPPVISELSQTSEQCGFNCLRLTLGSYKIVSDAYVTSQVPTWRDYLILSAPAVRVPSGVSIKTSADRELWRSTAAAGWERGKSDARLAFVEGFNWLTRDFDGMQRYYDLAQQGAVSMARVSVERRSGVIYVNGQRASQRETKVGLVVTPRFVSREGVARASTKADDLGR